MSALMKTIFLLGALGALLDVVGADEATGSGMYTGSGEQTGSGSVDDSSEEAGSGNEAGSGTEDETCADNAALCSESQFCNHDYDGGAGCEDCGGVGDCDSAGLPADGAQSCKDRCDGKLQEECTVEQYKTLYDILKDADSCDTILQVLAEQKDAVDAVDCYTKALPSIEEETCEDAVVQQGMEALAEAAQMSDAPAGTPSPTASPVTPVDSPTPAPVANATSATPAPSEVPAPTPNPTALPTEPAPEDCAADLGFAITASGESAKIDCNTYNSVYAAGSETEATRKCDDSAWQSVDASACELTAGAAFKVEALTLTSKITATEKLSQDEITQFTTKQKQELEKEVGDGVTVECTLEEASRRRRLVRRLADGESTAVEYTNVVILTPTTPEPLDTASISADVKSSAEAAAPDGVELTVEEPVATTSTIAMEVGENGETMVQESKKATKPEEASSSDDSGKKIAMGITIPIIIILIFAGGYFYYQKQQQDKRASLQDGIAMANTSGAAGTTKGSDDL